MILHQRRSTMNAFSISVRVYCGVPMLRDDLSDALERDGIRVSNLATLGCVLDAPYGFALKQLQLLGGDRLVVTTENPCPEYWEDLWMLGPCVLLVGERNLESLELALVRAASGEHYRETPSRGSCLTPAERALLRLSATGLGNKHIANRLRLQERTVQNGLTRVYAKLGLKNRTQAALYYWGVRQAFDA